MHETVANESERDHGTAENDDSQQSAAWLTGPNTDANGSPDAAETELPALLPSLDVIEFNEHRLRPVQPISGQTPHCELEQQLSSIAVGSATAAQDAQGCRNRESRREHHQRQNEQRGYDAPRSWGRRGLGRCATERDAKVAACSRPLDVRR